MGHIADELRITIKRLGVVAEEPSPVQLHSVREGLDARFIDPSGEGPLWERMQGEVSVRNPDAWQWISSVPLSGRAILFFEEQEEPAGFVFNSGADVVAVLAESTGFEFYLTDDAKTFLLAFNHHDYLSAAGTAVGWLRDLLRKGAPMVDS